MQPTRFLGTVTIEDQRSNLNVAKSHRNSQWSGVCGELTVDRSTVSHWATRFRVTLDDARPESRTHLHMNKV